MFAKIRTRAGVGACIAAALGFGSWGSTIAAAHPSLELPIYALALGFAIAAAVLGILLVVESRRRAHTSKDVSPDEWRAQEACFRNIKGEISGIWMQRNRTGTINWHISRANGATARDLQSFEDEAKAASQLLARTLPHYSPREFRRTFGINTVDQWLNALMMLRIDPASKFRHSSHGAVESEGRSVSRLVEMSALSCARVATGGRPDPFRFPIRKGDPA